MNEESIGADNVYRGDERAVLVQALKRSGMSARQAAAQMDMSDTRLRQIMNGYQPAGRGQRIAVIAPEDTLARIALVLGVTAEELEEAGRADAAREVRARSHERATYSDPSDSISIQRSIQEWAQDPLMVLPPDDALRLFSDSSLLGELDRRLHVLRAELRGDSPLAHREDDPSAFLVLVNEAEGGDGDAEDSDRGSAPTNPPLSEEPGTTGDLIAADEQETSISGEQEEPQEP